MYKIIYVILNVTPYIVIKTITHCHEKHYQKGNTKPHNPCIASSA